jgi:hypothetical protein
MEAIRKDLNRELDEVVSHLIATRMYDKAIGLIETFKDHFDKYEHFKGIIIQQYRIR